MPDTLRSLLPFKLALPIVLLTLFSTVPQNTTLAHRNEGLSIAALPMAATVTTARSPRREKRRRLAPDYCDRFRPGVGFRIEDISESDPRYIPYFIIAGPNEDHTFFVQFQYRIQDDNNAFTLDLSAVH